jgi:hypothetical protein
MIVPGCPGRYEVASVAADSSPFPTSPNVTAICPLTEERPLTQYQL